MNAENDAPTLTTVNTLTGGTEDTALTISYATLAAAANEADPDGDAFAFRIEAVSTGTLTKGGNAVTAGTTFVSSGASLVWTPAQNANGTLNAFTIKASDGTTTSTSAVQVQVSVAAVNDGLTLTAISTLSGATEDNSFTISYSSLAAASNVADVEGDTISFRIESLSTGTLSKSGVAVTEGSTLLGVGEDVVWAPAQDANGTLNAFTIKAHDGTTTSASAVQVQVSVASVNDAPTLTTVSTLTGATEDTPFMINYATLAGAANEADVEGDTVSFRVEAVSTGTLSKGGTAVTAGATLLSGGESLVWTPAADANGTLTIFVTVHDNGGTANGGVDTTTVGFQVTITPVNDPQALTRVAPVTGAVEDTPFDIRHGMLLAAADAADVDGDRIQFRVESVLAGTMAKNGAAVRPGTTFLSAAETLSWTPPPNANGLIEAFSVRAFDGHAASPSRAVVTIAVAPVNGLPRISVLPEQRTREDTPLMVELNLDDVETDQAGLRLQATTTNSKLLPDGSLLLSAGANPRLVLVPGPDENGTATVTVQVADRDGGVARSSFSFIVEPVNDPPTISTVKTLSMENANAGFTVTYRALASAADEADRDVDKVLFRLESLLRGTLAKNGTPALERVAVLGSDESLVWSPDPSASGETVAFTVKAWDGQLASTVAAPVIIVVPNTPPTLAGLSDSRVEKDPALHIDFTVGDAETRLENLVVEVLSSNTSLIVNDAILIFGTGSQRTLEAFPRPDQHGTTSLTVRVKDAGGLAATRILVATITPRNDPPAVAEGSPLTGAFEDTPFTVGHDALIAASNAVDGDADVLTFRVESITSGTLTKDGQVVTPSRTSWRAGERAVWTPPADASGTLSAFTISATDGTAVSASAVPVRIEVKAVNDAPTLTRVKSLAGASLGQPYTFSYADLMEQSDGADIENDPLPFELQEVVDALTLKGVNATPKVTLLKADEEWVWIPRTNGLITAFTVRAHHGQTNSATAVPVRIAVSVPVLRHSAKLTAGGGAAGDLFGNAVSVSGETAVRLSCGSSRQERSGRGVCVRPSRPAE